MADFGRLLTSVALAIGLIGGAAQAQVVSDCDQRTAAENLAEPWEENTATYAGGAVRVAKLDTVEPIAAAVHLMILSPPDDELGLRQCKLVSLGDAGVGFFGLDFPGRRAEYDPAKGLTLTFPAETPNVNTGSGKPATLRVTVDQATGKITAKLTE